MSEPARPQQSSYVEFEDAFENAPCGYLIISPEGYISKANATCAGWLGLEPAALAGKHFRDLLPVAGRVVFETSFRPLLTLQGGFEEIALELSTAAGAPLPMLASASSRREGGVITAIRLVLVRAASRRGYERDLRKREAVAVRQLADEQAESMLREQFIAVLGHDLRNPLAAVGSGVRLLQRDPSKEKAELVAAMMNASLLRMSAMIENVLDFARGRLGGGISLRREPADLEAVLIHMVDELRNANRGRVFVENYRHPSLVNCDLTRMSQMMSNLIGNACMYGAPATNIEVEAFTADEVLEISITNSGIAIPEEKMGALFQPFSHEPGSGPRQGLGLGLFIASEIAKSHGGQLTAASDVNETRFTFRMPLASA